MASLKKNDSGADSRTPWSTADKIYALVLFIIFIISLTVAIITFYLAFSDVPATIGKGPFGDYIAGVLNPILTFFTLFGILISIFLQRRELSLTRSELERSATALESQIASINSQNFEASFFQMLSTFNSIIDSIDLVRDTDKATTTGRDCFTVFYDRLEREFRRIKDNPKEQDGARILELSYERFWNRHSHELSNYYRMLYTILDFLDKNPLQKAYHSKILCAQLSDQELLLLFYNCLSDRGENLKNLAIKYKMFENLPASRLLDAQHVGRINGLGFGDNPM